MSSEQNKVILRAEHISKTYGEKKVLEDISIHLEQGELVSLLGVSGSGKSFSAKEEIVDLALSTEDDILILDPESEFASLVEALNGEVIRISATSDTHLNALDMDSAYGNDRNPLIEKYFFFSSLNCCLLFFEPHFYSLRTSLSTSAFSPSTITASSALNT